MSTSVLKSLQQLKDATFHVGADRASIDALTNCGAPLPESHREILEKSNGIEVYGGYFRLFGVDSKESIDLLNWNEPDCWKFAWQDRCSGFLCFAETAWGDQFAYSLASLSHGSSEVYFLDALSMSGQVVAKSFDEFLKSEFLRSAREPYDLMIREARQKWESIEVNSHLVYVPSILIGGVEDIDNVQKISARSAMIFNGDIALQLDASPPNRAVESVLPYEDELHRMRLKLQWI